MRQNKNHTKPVNLLILDDSKENIIRLSTLLSEVAQINVIHCTDPNEALKMCSQNDIAIALIDAQMSAINGFEFVSLLKSNPKTNHIIAIMIVAISQEHQPLLKGVENGTVDFLYHPLNPETTLAKISAFVRQIHTQEEIKQKNTALEVSQRQLHIAKEEAQEARKSKESFLANMSHEIRTPINGIVGIINILRNTELNDEQRDWVSRLSSASDSLLHIINDILDLSKIDSGMMKIEFENFSIRKTLMDINNFFKIKALDKNLAFEIDIDPRVPEYIKSSPLRIKQIIDNLISNALKFTETGKVILKVNVVNQVDNRYTIKFTVIDTGIGIKSETIEKIFLAFEQGHDRITKKYGGTGLGLAIVKRLADLLDGKIEAKSVYGEGSAFSFQLTVEQVSNFKRETKTDAKALPSLHKFKGIRILVAEDNELNSFMLVHILKSWECEVDVAKNGRLAVEYVNRNNYDLIMMDTHMPIMSGFEAIQKIKNHSDPRKAYIPIITISASVLQHQQAAAYEAGADNVIGKPFDPIDLHQKIDKLISKRV